MHTTNYAQITIFYTFENYFKIFFLTYSAFSVGDLIGIPTKWKYRKQAIVFMYLANTFLKICSCSIFSTPYTNSITVIRGGLLGKARHHAPG